jgi:hypothetical protein
MYFGLSARWTLELNTLGIFSKYDIISISYLNLPEFGGREEKYT